MNPLSVTLFSLIFNGVAFHLEKGMYQGNQSEKPIKKGKM
jgi:hypothetical protein